MVKMAIRLAVVSSALILGLTAATQTAGATHRVGPHQFFAGVINGKDGNTTVPIPIDMACFGPLTPGETGHPMGGQTLAVHQLFPPSVANTLGQTGNDSTIEVFFGAPPPAPIPGASPIATTRTVAFTRYDRTKGLPTSLTLPCGGKGTVWFVPIPVVPPSQAEAVPVVFESQP
jgi:hypothetical protein